MNSLFVNAIKEAAKVRDSFGLRMFEPLNIYDLCHKASVLVRIVNINMEGIYIKANHNKKATILLSNERPLTRRVFTCTHEYGHHHFGHGSKIDALDYSKKYTYEQNQEELLVNAFAGSLLMPIGGVKTQFSKRKLQPTNSTPLNFYTISSYQKAGIIEAKSKNFSKNIQIRIAPKNFVGLSQYRHLE